MRIAFLQDLWFEWQAPMLLSAIARQRGHQCQLIIDGDPERAAAKALARRPDLVAFSVITGSHWYAVRAAAAVKRRSSTPVVVGGPHATLCPDLARDPAVDMLCRGEGETTFAALLDRLGGGGSLADVPGLCYRDGDGGPRYNAPAPAVDLDALPFLDRELYCRYRVFGRETTRVFYASRGCRHDCAYCCAPALRLAGGGGPRARLRSPALVCREINETRRRWRTRVVFFEDDTFAQDRDWAGELLGRYRVEVGLPFMCMLRASDLDEDLAAALGKSQCVGAVFGVETADQALRQGPLRRDESDEDLLRAARLLRRHRVRSSTFNMLGLPGEGLDGARRTVAFNRRLDVDFPWATLYRPFPGTPLERRAVAMGLLGPDDSRRSAEGNLYTSSLLDLPERAAIENLQRLFPFAVRWPALAGDAFIRRRRAAGLYYLAFCLYSFYREVRMWRRSPLIALWTGLLNQVQYRRARRARRGQAGRVNHV